MVVKGGNFFRCISLYWLSTAFYDAGIYVADARASLLALTSSDMVSNFNSGIVKGDWYYILSPLGLLEYDILIGNILKICACFCFVYAIFCFYSGCDTISRIF